MRMLLIEDDADISRELTLRWRPRGWIVQACDTLAMASAEMDLAQSGGGFDLVVLDLGLPDGDGLEWLARLRIVDVLHLSSVSERGSPISCGNHRERLDRTGPAEVRFLQH